MKKIEDVVRMNKRKKNNKKFDDISELVKDGNNWMSQYDKKILGFGGAPTVKKNTVVKNEQDILFDA